VSATVPETPVEAVPGETFGDRGNNDRLLSPSLLAARRFELVESPVAPPAIIRGDMADTSISLGEYARKFRLQKQRAEVRAAAKITPQPVKPKQH
jgi:hypothetical protein